MASSKSAVKSESDKVLAGGTSLTNAIDINKYFTIWEPEGVPDYARVSCLKKLLLLII